MILFRRSWNKLRSVTLLLLLRSNLWERVQRFRCVGLAMACSIGLEVESSEFVVGVDDG